MIFFFSVWLLLFIFKSLVKLCFEDIRIIPKGIHAVFLKKKKGRILYINNRFLWIFVPSKEHRRAVFSITS